MSGKTRHKSHLPASSSLLLFGEAASCSSLPEVLDGVEEKLIPEKGEASRQCGLQKAGRQTLEEASDALLFGYLDRAVHQASIAPHLTHSGQQSENTLKNTSSKHKNTRQTTLPVQTEFWPPQSPPPAASS